jgi:hypothetical protein
MPGPLKCERYGRTIRALSGSVLAAARSVHDLTWWWRVGPRHPWLTWTFRGLGIFGYVGLLGFVLLLSREDSGRPGEAKAAKTVPTGEQEQLWNWKAWVVLAVFAIPVFAFGAFVLMVSGPILGVMFLVVVPVGLVDVLKPPPERSQPGDGDEASRDVGGA